MLLPSHAVDGCLSSVALPGRNANGERTPRPGDQVSESYKGLRALGQTAPVRVVVITGPPGAGKTTVLTALTGLLEADDIRFAAVELDALALVHPWPDDHAAFDHLAYVAASFRRRGYPTLLVGATVVNREYLRRLLDAVAAVDVMLVRLDAPTELLRKRIARREPPEWVGLLRLLEAAGTIATELAALPGFDLILNTEHCDPRTLAAAIRTALRER